MSFTYDPTLPTPKDQVRLRLVDRLSASAVFQDEEINQMLAIYSYNEACAQLAESAGASFAQKASSVDNGPVKYQYAGRSKFYMDLAASIRATAQPAPGAPVYTGATAGDMAAPDLSKYRTD